MSDPCEDCIALAFSNGDAPLEAGRQLPQDDKPAPQAAPLSRDGDRRLDEGVPPPPRPVAARARRGPPRLSTSLACPSHGKGRGWSIRDPCLECLALAEAADL